MADSKSGNKTGSPFLDNQMKSAKNYRPPASYKPLSTGEKVLMASSFIPSGVVSGVASAAGKAVAKTSAKKYVEKAGETVVKKFTQGAKAKVEVTPPKKTGVGSYSPTKGSKISVEKTKKGQSPLQQSSNKEGARVRETVKKAGTAASNAGKGAIAAEAMRQQQVSKKKK